MATDPVITEIIRNYMETVAAEIVETMVRTALQPIFNESHDCSGGLFYYNNEEVSLIARADAIPTMTFPCLQSVNECLQFFAGDLNEGDVIIVSDPYFGGSHIPDYTVVKPVFFDGEPLFFPAVRGHVLDAGGPTPSSMDPFATEIWQEGFRFAPLKLYEKGQLRREAWSLMLTNTRMPHMLEGDFAAMIGGCAVGEERLRELVEKYGVETVRDSVEALMDYTERRFRNEVRSWPDGVYRGASSIDTDYSGTRDVTVRVSIEIDGDRIRADFSDSDAQTPSAINSTRANTLSYLYSAISAVMPDVPVNTGVYRSVEVTTVPGTVVHSMPPVGAGMSTTAIGSDVGEAVMAAFEQFVPRKVATTVIDLSDLWALGFDNREGDEEAFIQFDYHASPCSTGGTYGVDGWGAWTPIFSALNLNSIEMSEVQYPCLYRQAEFTTDTAAPGQWRGSPAYMLRRQPYRSLGPTLHTGIVQSTIHPLRGYQGGSAAAGNFMVFREGTDAEVIISSAAMQVPVAEGETVAAQSCGGGGWGDPLDRSPDTVLADVLDDYVSLSGALHDYGVVIDATTFSVDLPATESERRKLKTERSDQPWLALGRKQTLDRIGLLTPAGELDVSRIGQ
jgi:N-methylhydantoinase B